MKNKGCFKKGLIPHNKGRKMKEYMSDEGLEKIKKSQFKKGDSHTGDKHVTWGGGIQKMTKDCVHLWDGTNKRVRRPKKNYEDVYGKVPEGFVIFHIDGNKDNDHYSNLEAISRAELLKRNKK